MSGWLILAAGVPSWVVATAVLARFFASSNSFNGRCHGDERKGERRRDHIGCSVWHKGHPVCWHSDGQVGFVAMGWAGAFALLWPLLIPVVAAYWLATRKPTAIASQRRIAELERELGMEPSR